MLKRLHAEEPELFVKHPIAPPSHRVFFLGDVPTTLRVGDAFVICRHTGTCTFRRGGQLLRRATTVLYAHRTDDIAVRNFMNRESRTTKAVPPLIEEGMMECVARMVLEEEGFEFDVKHIRYTKNSDEHQFYILPTLRVVSRKNSPH